jgi:O-antigen/teichoic acid export membrane protein
VTTRSRTSIPLLAIAYGASAGANLLLNVSVGRALGAAALGAFALATSVARILYAATDVGATTHLTRLVSRDRAAAQRDTSLFLSLRLLTTPLVAVLTMLIALAHRDDELVVFAMIALAQGLIMVQGLYEALFLGFDRQAAVAALSIASSACVVAATATSSALFSNLTAFALMYVAATLAGSCAWVALARRSLGVRPRAVFAFDGLARHLRQSWSIGLSVLLSIAALKFPVIVLGFAGTRADVGAFSAVDMFVTASAIAQTAVTSAYYPRLAATFRTAPHEFRRMFWQSNALLAGFGISVGALLVLWGPELISIVFPSKDFAGVTSLVQIIGWSTPSLLLAHHNIYIFAASDRERTNLRLMSVWFVGIAALQLLLTPIYGVVGTAWGLLLGRLVGLIVLAIGIRAARIHRGGDRGAS